MKFTTSQLISLQRRIDQQTRQWNNTWEELAYFFAPQRVGFLHKRAQGEKKTDRVHDSTAMTVADDLTHYLAGALTPSTYNWANIQFRSEELRKNKEASMWLEDAVHVIFEALKESNFYEEITEFYRDISVFGTGALECIEKEDIRGDFDGLHFNWIHMREVSGVRGRYGKFDLTLRLFKDTARRWYEEFGDAAGPKLLAAMETRPDREFKFLHAIYPRDLEDIDVDSLDMMPAEDDKLPYASVWINYTEKEHVQTSGFYEPNRVVVRWDYNTDNDFGHGPGLRALPDVRTLNEAKRLEMVAWEKAIDPTLKTTANNVVGDLNRAAGGLVTVRRYDELGPIHEYTKWDLSLIKGEELVANIRDIFFSDLIQEPGTIESSAKTAYEVARRMERAQRILGEAVSQIRSNLLDWVIERSFGLLLRNGAFGEMPAILMDENQRTDLDIQITSHLAISQQSAALENTLMFMNDVAMIAGMMNPEAPQNSPVWDRVDLDGLIDELSQRRNVPAGVLTGEDELEEARQEKKRQKQLAETMELTKNSSEAIRNVGAGAGPEAAQAALGGQNPNIPIPGS